MPVYKDEERGTWYVRCYYEDFTGKKKQIKKRGFKLQREAKEWEADFLRKQKGSLDMTFHSMYEIYIEDMGHRCRQSTIDGKKHVFEKLILPYFENKPINKITPKDIRAWQNEMIAKEYSNSYLDRMQNMMTALFNYAVDYFNLSENPCHKAGRMGKREVVVSFWTKDEFDRILAAMEDDPTAHVSFSILYYSGIRFGEFLALTPTDFDFEKNSLDITKSLQRVKKQDVVTPPKTPKNIRNIIIPDFVMKEVKDYMLKLYDLKDTDRVFPFTKSYINNAMARACKKTGVKNPPLARQLSYQLGLCTTAHIRTVRTRNGADHLKHLFPPVSEQASGSGGYDAEPAPKGHGNIRSECPVRSIGRIKTTGHKVQSRKSKG